MAQWVLAASERFCCRGGIIARGLHDDYVLALHEVGEHLAGAVHLELPVRYFYVHGPVPKGKKVTCPHRPDVAFPAGHHAVHPVGERAGQAVPAAMDVQGRPEGGQHEQRRLSGHARQRWQVREASRAPLGPAGEADYVETVEARKGRHVGRDERVRGTAGVAGRPHRPEGRAGRGRLHTPDPEAGLPKLGAAE